MSEQPRPKLSFLDRFAANPYHCKDSTFWVLWSGPAGVLLFHLLGIEPTWVGFPAGFAVAMAIAFLVILRSDTPELSPADREVIASLAEFQDSLSRDSSVAVELRPAWTFTCEACGRDNFTPAVVPCSLEGQIPEGFELGDFEGGEWITRPERVECEYCGAEFVVEED